MSRFFADLHVHSRFSRATSKSLEPAVMARWAALKGIGLLGTGDMVHPGWLDVLEESLAEGPDGLCHLAGNPGGTAFLPTGEISLIYKQDGRTRKVHLLLAAPNLRTARKLSEKLDRMGNIRSDGRPILGLSARTLTEVALSVDPEIQIVPAHVWTPWFSIFGSKSGFDSVEECFGDLSGRVTALETGLSSDPEMNRLVSKLDRYALVSFSDAHSPEKLGREATVMGGDVSWASVKSALLGGKSLAGTVEFFPEEGKYHLDGHVKCGPALTPARTKECRGICPVCGKPLTVGVLSRVLDLADREEAPGGGPPDWHLVPLMEVLSQVLGRGVQTMAVREAYLALVGEFGSEFKLLMETPAEDVGSFGGPLLARAVANMRAGRVAASGGYDGQAGTVGVLSPADRKEIGDGPAPAGYPGSKRRARPAV
ncbi:MAG: endonuclease Q family protein [Deltaproteobacteria bacterium]|nr:endonuclease Q family protein [Deltaproteobacteria bacterium]